MGHSVERLPVLVEADSYFFFVKMRTRTRSGTRLRNCEGRPRWDRPRFYRETRESIEQLGLCGSSPCHAGSVRFCAASNSIGYWIPRSAQDDRAYGRMLNPRLPGRYRNPRKVRRCSKELAWTPFPCAPREPHMLTGA